jgi:predicted HAD superfamily hydrolase
MSESNGSRSSFEPPPAIAVRRIRSFDVFDTLIVRATASPVDIFVLVGCELSDRNLYDDSPFEFAGWRVAAESMSRQQAPNRETTLAEIYEALAEQLKWDNERSKVALELELKIERENTQAVPDMVAAVAQARAEADQVLFLSDMYLPAWFLAELLQREGFFKPGDMVLVSGDLRQSKHSGRMYAEVRRRFPDCHDWVHTGDNAHADGAMARRAGVRCRIENSCNLTRYERVAHGGQWPTPLWRSQVAAAMRLGRLAIPDRNDPKAVHWQVGVEVAGPLLFSFVFWCLDKATQRGIKRLYFISRDGQILCRLSKLIAEKWNYNVECRYLYGSRQAWRPGAIDFRDPGDLAWIVPYNDPVTIRQAFSRVAATPEKHREELLEIGFAVQDWDRELSEKETNELRRWFATSSAQAEIRPALEVSRKLVIEYLEQEQMFDGTGFALVDLGFLGNLQRSVGRILKPDHGNVAEKLTGFYLDLRSGVNEQTFFDYWGEPAPPFPRVDRQNGSLFEIFTTADHGSVRGYKKLNGVIVPDLTSDRHEPALKWGVLTLQAGIIKFAEIFLRLSPRTKPAMGEFRFLCQEIFNLFYYSPIAAEAATIGAIDATGQEIERIHLAPVSRLSWSETLAAIRDVQRRPSGWWPEGQYAAYKGHLLWGFLAARRLKKWINSKR